MKLKILLLFFCLTTIIAVAQEPNRSLIFSEVRIAPWQDCYIELTNMGDKDINLGEYKFGHLRLVGFDPIYDVYNDTWTTRDVQYAMLPEVILKPGESWIQTLAFDFGPEMYKRQIPGFEGQERPKQIGLYDVADFLIHFEEQRSSEFPFVKDSITPMQRNEEIPLFGVMESRPSSGFYIEHHFAENDSVVVDQVGGVFDNNGRNYDQPYSVAGVEGATGSSVLVRKFSVKLGTLDFANARGIGLDDSEWMPVTYSEGYNSWRDLWWTVGNHGDYKLDENTLESDFIDIDFANKTLSVPWGVRRLDDIMTYMKKKPGIAWNYELNDIVQDSVYRSARAGDKLTIYVLGSSLQQVTFDIVVKEPSEDVNIVVPVAHVNNSSVREGGPTVTNTQAGILAWPRVTNNSTDNDTITGTWFGLPHALRTDSLLKYLEKPVNASWEFEWVDGIERADLKNGDRLKVIAENGDVKQYFIQVQPYRPGNNANLSSITWPDIPDFYKGIFGWIGDTIPGFSPRTYNYQVTIPFDVDGVPAMIAKAQDLNARVNVKRATTFSGTLEDRTISYEVIAEDDSVKNTYNVELIKQQLPENIQPYYAEPFISEITWRDLWRNSYGEICNPGNQPLDLSNYMIAQINTTNPADAIQSVMSETDWLHRYRKYVPGYKWVNESDWLINPGVLELDLSVNPIVQPGDVFCLGAIDRDNQISQVAGDYTWHIPLQLDVQFYNSNSANGTYLNPWGEEVAWVGDPVNQWKNTSIFLFKILNDSIHKGLKPANDPDDFELIEAFGMADGGGWQIGGINVTQVNSLIRKPNIYKANNTLGLSMGDTPEDSEWTIINNRYWQERGYGWPLDHINVSSNIGQHYFVTPTHYMSTIKSIVYKVSEGFSLNEQIRGITTGTAVSEFLANIIKSNENQTLKIISKADGNELSTDALLSLNDTLVVLSADSTNISKYAIEVSENGLSSNAIITSNRYMVNITDEPHSVNENKEFLDGHLGTGTISGFEYGTQLKTILNNIEVPYGANLTILNSDGAYVPLIVLNFDTTYVAVTVNSNQYFEVIAENGKTTIMYQLLPEASESNAFVTSNVYSVNQGDLLIDFIPRGTTVSTFLSNVFPSTDASIKLIDKLGLERTDGNIVQDDRLVVTSPDGTVQTVYYLSMLRTEYIQQTTYLAYVTSNVYSVDQLDMSISGASGQTRLSTFLSRIEPALGATISLLDKNGNIKSSGDLNDGDVLKVVSADGNFEAIYDLKLILTTVDRFESAQITLYPNPTAGKISISGLTIGGKIQVFNSVGVSIENVKINKNLESVDLTDQPSGVYLVVINHDNLVLPLKKFKVIKK